ncbi:MAG: DUF6505 family protein [Gammaproteobacteria bacterium]|nr:DUF6505 family protein [Gammaproteobacteria bacterium]
MNGRKSTRKMLRCARLDDSDEEVFEKAADAGEWAIPGSFTFLDDDETSLTGKRLQAFNAGFLGLDSFGWCTIVSVATASEEQIQEAVNQLSQHLLDHYGAPDRAAARQAARSELAYAESLCEHEIGTLVALERELTDDGIEERFKRFVPTQDADWEDAKPISLSDLVKQSDL